MQALTATIDWFRGPKTGGAAISVTGSSSSDIRGKRQPARHIPWRDGEQPGVRLLPGSMICVTSNHGPYGDADNDASGHVPDGNAEDSSKAHP
jgi:hypothetical protein